MVLRMCSTTTTQCFTFRSTDMTWANSSLTSLVDSRWLVNVKAKATTSSFLSICRRRQETQTIRSHKQLVTTIISTYVRPSSSPSSGSLRLTWLLYRLVLIRLREIRSVEYLWLQLATHGWLKAWERFSHASALSWREDTVLKLSKYQQRQFSKYYNLIPKIMKVSTVC